MENLQRLDKAGDIIKNLSFFNNINLNDADNYYGMFQSWEKIVGKKLAGYSRIKDLDKNSLIVEADHPAIIQLLQLNYRQTLNKINIKYPDLQISDIRILLRNPDNDYVINKKSTVLAGDEDQSVKSVGNSVDLNSIDNENFRNLLLKMKKRS